MARAAIARKCARKTSSLDRAYIYEAEQGNTVFIKDNGDVAGCLEVMPLERQEGVGEPITGEEMAAVARELGYEVTHWRFGSECLCLVGEDGTQSPTSPGVGMRDFTYRLLNGLNVGSA